MEIEKLVLLTEDITKRFCDPETAFGALREELTSRKCPYNSMGANNSKTQLPGFYRPPRKTCPSTCPYLSSSTEKDKGGCYGQFGYLKWISRGSTSEQAALTSFVVCSVVSHKLCRKPARTTVTGDFCKSGKPHKSLIQKVCESAIFLKDCYRISLVAYGYTHIKNPKTIQMFRDSGIMMLASDFPGPGGAVVWPYAEMDKLRALYPKTKFVKCAHTTRKIPCRRCSICLTALHKECCVVLAPHGSGKNKATKASKHVLER